MPLLMALVGCIVILHLTDEVRVRRLQRSMLTSPALVLLGKMSLSLFLLHPLVNTVLTLAFAQYTRTFMPWWALALVGPPLSLLVAYGYFRAVEVPIRRLRRRRAASSTRILGPGRVAMA